MFLLMSKVLIIYFILSMRSMAYEGVGSLKRSIDHPIDCSGNSNETTEINLKLRNQMFHLIDLLNGSVKIEFEEIPDNQVLLTFASGQTNKNSLINDIDCWTTNNKSMVVSNLIENETQTFCLMDKEDQTVSPLDCLSILPRNSLYDPASDAVWLTEDDKLLYIGLLVMGLIICLVIGFGIGMWIVKRQSIARNNRNQSISSRPDLMPPDWKHDKRNEDFNYPYTDNDNVSIASDRSSYVMAVNPSRFDLIKMRLEKSENPTVHESGNLYDLEDMPYSKAPTAPDGFRDSGISTCGPIYAISSKVIDRNDNKGEDLYLCVNQDIGSNDKKNE